MACQYGVMGYLENLWLGPGPIFNLLVLMLKYIVWNMFDWYIRACKCV